jgi:hypothetical protein
MCLRNPWTRFERSGEGFPKPGNGLHRASLGWLSAIREHHFGGSGPRSLAQNDCFACARKCAPLKVLSSVGRDTGNWCQLQRQVPGRTLDHPSTNPPVPVSRRRKLPAITNNQLPSEKAQAANCRCGFLLLSSRQLRTDRVARAWIGKVSEVASLHPTRRLLWLATEIGAPATAIANGLPSQ